MILKVESLIDGVGLGELSSVFPPHPRLFPPNLHKQSSPTPGAPEDPRHISHPRGPRGSEAHFPPQGARGSKANLPPQGGLEEPRHTSSTPGAPRISHPRGPRGSEANKSPTPGDPEELRHISHPRGPRGSEAQLPPQEAPMIRGTHLPPQGAPRIRGTSPTPGDPEDLRHLSHPRGPPVVPPFSLWSV